MKARIQRGAAWINQFPTTLVLLVLFLLLLTLDVTVLVLYKYVETTLPHNAQYFWQVYRQPLVWVALGISAFHLCIWTRILRMTDLSLAYPISSLSYPLTMLAGMFIFHEKLSMQVWVGSLFIILGVILISNTRLSDASASEPTPIESASLFK